MIEFVFMLFGFNLHFNINGCPIFLIFSIILFKSLSGIKTCSPPKFDSNGSAPPFSKAWVVKLKNKRLSLDFYFWESKKSLQALLIFIFSSSFKICSQFDIKLFLISSPVLEINPVFNISSGFALVK